MSVPAKISYRIRLTRQQLAALVARKWKQNFYLYLAGIFTALILVDAAFLHIASNMRQATFDMMVRYRVLVPKPDKDIVIVDINEASLAAMAKDYGRWPWPRQVLGEFVEQLEGQQPKAIVFDILFSDPDIYNADSDAYFDAAIASTRNTFFPMLRLDPADDKLSQLKPGMIPGVSKIDDDADPDATLAMVIPFFKSVQQAGRLGTHNIYPDPDGIARAYPVYRDESGWLLPSLPLRMAQEFKWNEPDDDSVLLNWRGPPFTYHSVSFSDVFADLTSKDKKRPADEFKDKIVIIGSTAPSLFDIKATPMARMHPGVEILATAIDNFKRNDFLRFPEARLIYLLVTLAVIWGTAWGFYRDAGRERIDKLFGASQFILIGISYASINLSTLYINLTGPITVGLAYFSVARLYAFATRRELEQNAVRNAQLQQGEWRGMLMLIRIDGHAALLNEAMRKKLRTELARIGDAEKNVEILGGEQHGLWSLLEHCLLISWLSAANDTAARSAINSDIAALKHALPDLVRKCTASPDADARCIVHEGRIAGGDAAGKDWRMLFAEALLRLDKEIP